MSTSIAPFFVAAGTGPSLQTPTADRVTIKSHSGDTQGFLTVLEFEHQPMSGPALHIHHREDELWWVIEGEFRFRIGDTDFRSSQGDVVFGPRETPHCYQNVGQEPGRVLTICTPAGLERFFEDFAATAPGPLDFEHLKTIGRAHGLDFVGPPLAVSDPL